MMKNNMIITMLVLYSSVMTARNAEGVVVLPFQRVGKIIYLEAEVEGKSGGFIIDTGLSEVVLNAAYFENGYSSPLVLKGFNGALDNVSHRKVQLTIGTIQKQNVATIVADLSHLEKFKSTRFLGILGNSFLANFEVALDYYNNEITFYELDRKGNRLWAELDEDVPDESLKMSFKGHIPTIEMVCGEQRLRLGIDSGAESNLFNAKVLEKLGDHFSQGVSKKVGGLGKEIKLLVAGKTSGLRIGSLPLAPMKTILVDLSPYFAKLHGPRTDGLVGYELLKEYKIAINYRKKKVHLWRHGFNIQEDLILVSSKQRESISLDEFP